MYIFLFASHNISEVPSLKFLDRATKIKGIKRMTANLCGRNGIRIQILDPSLHYMFLLGVY